MTTAENPGYLKLDLALSGLAWMSSDPAPEDLRGALDTGRIELLLPDDVIFAGALDAPTSRRRSDRSAPYRLVHETARYFVQRERDPTEVRLLPSPRFTAGLTQTGVPMRAIGRVQGSFLVLAPLGGCGLSLSDGWCSACRANGQRPPFEPAQPALATADVVDTVRAAFDEGAIEFVVFNHGGAFSDDGGIAALEPYIRAVKRHFDTLVAVQSHPPAQNAWIDRTYAMGVDSVSYGVGMHGIEARRRACPGQADGRDRTYEALAHAAAIFPSGTVWTELLLGHESATATADAIDILTQAGVVPIISLAASAADDSRPTLPEVVPIMAHLFHAARRAKVNMGWVRDVSFGITPLEARFFVAEEARLSVVQQFYRSRIGGLTARNLARLRRRLRVRTVSDSFDSSHL